MGEKPCFRKGIFTECSHFKQLGGSNGVPGTDRGCVKSRRTGLQLIPPCQDEKPIIYCQRPPVTVTNKGYCYWMVGRPNNPNIYHRSMLCFWGDFWWFSTLLIWKGEPKKWAECIVHQCFPPWPLPRASNVASAMAAKALALPAADAPGAKTPVS